MIETTDESETGEADDMILEDCLDPNLDCLRAPRSEEEPAPAPGPDKPVIPGTPLPSVTGDAPQAPADVSPDFQEEIQADTQADTQAEP